MNNNYVQALSNKGNPNYSVLECQSVENLTDFYLRAYGFCYDCEDVCACCNFKSTLIEAILLVKKEKEQERLMDNLKGAQK